MKKPSKVLIGLLSVVFLTAAVICCCGSMALADMAAERNIPQCHKSMSTADQSSLPMNSSEEKQCCQKVVSVFQTPAFDFKPFQNVLNFSFEHPAAIVVAIQTPLLSGFGFSRSDGPPGPDDSPLYIQFHNLRI